MHKYKCCECDCNCEAKFKSLAPKTCGSRVCVDSLHKKTNLKRYGHISNLHGVEGRKKVRDTLARRYGDDITNISQLESVKKKKIKTCRSNFGCNYPMESKKIRNKSKEKCLEKYGVDNVSKSQTIINKIRQTKSVIGTDGLNSFQRANVSIQKSNLKKYGVRFFFQTQEFKDRYVKIMLKKYGVDNVWKSKYFHKEMIARGIRYGKADIKKKADYYREVIKITKRNVKKYQDILFYEVDVNDKNYHIDHIYSIHFGFINQISPEVIGSIVNLQMLLKDINRKKLCDCWITQEELMERYGSFMLNNA